MIADNPCRGSCGQCLDYAAEAAMLWATFRCSSCGQLVGWCDGGSATPEDPKGDRCAACANLYHAALKGKDR